MDRVKPNYKDFGLSTTMGPQLRKMVELQLLSDLTNYGLTSDDLKFDWSDSCIEGHETSYLDGDMENFSGIALFNAHDKLVADGGMEFIHEGDIFLVYWDYITVWQDNKIVFEKAKPGIPDHIWQQIPDDMKANYETKRR